MEIKLHGGAYKIGQKVERRKGVVEILEIIRVEEKYELDGVTYSEYPGETPDNEWNETVCIVRVLSSEEVQALKDEAQAKRDRQEAEREAKLEEYRQHRYRQEAKFRAFLEGKRVNNVWSGYDLPTVAYSQYEDNPMRKYPEAYTAKTVGNGLGFTCATWIDLEQFFLYIYRNDTREQTEWIDKKCTPYATEKCKLGETEIYTAGAEYYRWLRARKLA